MKVARFLVSPVMLFDGYPSDFTSSLELLATRVTPEGLVEFTVRHDQLPEFELRAGVDPPLVLPMFEKRATVVFKGWEPKQ